MANHLKWETKLINRPVYSLNAENPLRMSLTEHKEKTAARFDMHYEIELGILVSGSMKRYYQNLEITLKPGDIWICGMWEPHGFRITKLPCKTIVFPIYPQLLLGVLFEELPDFKPFSFFTEPAAERPKLNKKQRAEILRIAKRLEKIYFCKGKERLALLRVQLYELLLTLYASRKSPKKTAAQATPETINIIDKAIRMVFASKILVTEEAAAKYCGLSKNRFNKVFAETTGMSFYKFALKYRLSNVAGRLLHSEDPLKAIAADWGFFDASHLHRLFVKHYGCLPGDYKKQYSGKTPAK